MVALCLAGSCLCLDVDLGLCVCVCVGVGVCVCGCSQLAAGWSCVVALELEILNLEV